jgi:hypothetical protein
MESKRLIQFCELRGRDSPDPTPEPFGCNGSDLLGLRLGVDGETSRGGRQEHLEWIDLGDVARHRHDGDDATPKPGCCRVGPIIADDDGGALLV